MRATWHVCILKYMRSQATHIGLIIGIHMQHLILRVHDGMYGPQLRRARQCPKYYYCALQRVHSHNYCTYTQESLTLSEVSLSEPHIMVQ